MTVRLHVVDDSATIQKVIKIAFSQHDAEIVCSSSLVEAMHAAQESPSGLLIVDANISGDKSVEDILRLKEASGGAQVLLLRGSYDGTDEQSFVKAGFQHILRKPFESHDIVAVVTKLVEVHLLEEQGTTPPSPPPPPTVDLSSTSAGGGFATPPPPTSGGTMPPNLASPENPNSFTDLSDTSGVSVPLPPPIREKIASGILDTPPNLPDPSQSSEPAPASSVEMNLGQEPAEQNTTPPHLSLTPEPFTGAEIPLSTFEEKESEGSIPEPPPANIPLEPLTPPAPPPPVAPETSNMKGKKAFAEPMQPNVAKAPPPPPPPQPPKLDGSESAEPSSVLEEFKGDVKDIRLEIARQMREQLPALVKEAVENYCAIHFPKITREIVTAELRRLADEKARHLIDN